MNRMNSAAPLAVRAFELTAEEGLYGDLLDRHDDAGVRVVLALQVLETVADRLVAPQAVLDTACVETLETIAEALESAACRAAKAAHGGGRQ